MMSETLATMHAHRRRRRRDDIHPARGAVPATPRRTIIIHKLRESKWFEKNETSILCAVAETGFVVERRRDARLAVTVWQSGYENSKDPTRLQVYVVDGERVKICTLDDYWSDDTTIRISNRWDSNTRPLCDQIIKKQCENAMRYGRKWRNDEEFVHFCRYGPVEVCKFGKITDRLRWNAEQLLTKIKKLSTNK